MLRIHVNGETRSIDAGSTVVDLLRTLGLGSDGVAVEVNLTILPRASHADTRLEDGDRVEVVTFVGGG